MIFQRGAHHRPLEDVEWISADGADHMNGDDTVLGLVVDGRARALPWWIMKNHHVANLVLEGRSIMVVLCEACAGAAAFDATIGGRRHTFRVEGKYRATHVLGDAETMSLWSPFWGEAVYGPLQRTRLERLPVYQCTWREWTGLFPATLVPVGRDERRDGHGSDFPSPAVCEFPSFAEKTRERRDRRLRDLEVILGVAVDGQARAYPLRALHRQGPVLNDELAGRPVLVLAKPASWLAIAFERRLDGRVIAFRSGASEATSFAFEDVETGSRWDVAGTAVSGPLAGRALPFAHSGIEKWYAWAAAHPYTDVFEGR